MQASMYSFYWFKEMALRIMNEIDKMRLNFLKKIDTFYIK